jgi:hypothetical protein
MRLKGFFTDGCYPQGQFLRQSAPKPDIINIDFPRIRSKFHTEEEPMKFMTVWSYPPENRDEAQARFKETKGDKPPKGIKLIGRWHAIGGAMGVHICECDDPMLMAKWAQRWSDLLSIEIYPAATDEEIAKMLE